jgi:hypothetical protein
VTIEEVKRLKVDLEDQTMALVHNFYRDTGLMVEGFALVWLERIGGDRILDSVTARVVVP